MGQRGKVGGFKLSRRHDEVEARRGWKRSSLAVGDGWPFVRAAASAHV